jgi:teichuronic acid exporter
MNFEGVASRLGIAALAKLAANLFSWVSTILLLRWLNPSDYGLVAIASIWLDFCFQFLDSSVSADIVRRKYLSTRRAKYLAGCIVLLGGSLSLLLALSSPLMAAFYGQPILATVILVKSLELLVSAILVVPEARLLRSLDTNFQARLIFFGTLTGSAFALLGAWAGMGLWSLLVGTIVMKLLKWVMIARSRSSLLVKPLFSLRIMRKIMIGNGHLIWNRMLYIFYEYVPTLLSGRILGPLQTGYYFTSYDLAGIPGSRMMNIINQVALPVYSRLQFDKERFESALLRGVALICLVYWPCIVGLGSVAEPFVKLLLGEKWVGATEVFAIMCFAWALRSIWDFLENPLVAMHQEKLLGRLQVFRITCLVLGCWFARSLGAKGFALVFLLVSIMSSALAVYFGGKALQINRTSLMLILTKGFASVVCMAICVMQVQSLFVLQSTVLRLIVGIATGMLTFLLSAYFMQRSAFSDLLGLLKHGFVRRKTNA